MKDLKTMSTPIINNGLSRLSVKSKNGTIGPDGTVKKQKKCNLYGKYLL